MPTSLDVWHALELSVTAVSAGGSATATSPHTLAVAPAGSAASARPAVVTAPSVTGTAQIGQTLSASVGAWTGSPTSFAYQWQRCDAAGAGCAAIPAETASSYIVAPGDLGTTLSLVVTATGVGGSQSATAPTTAAVVAAPVPPAVVGTLVAQAGSAGAVVTTDGRATVTWQPGAVPVAATVTLAPSDTPPAIAGTGVALAVTPAQQTLPWPVDVAYAAAPAGQVVGFSADGRVWVPVTALSAPTLAGGLIYGSYIDGTTLHVLTRRPGRIALFRPGRWGDPRRISPRPPVIRRMTPLQVTRRADGTVLLRTRLSTSSQAHLYATPLTPRTVILATGSRLAGGTSRQALVLQSGGFPVRWRIKTRAAIVSVRIVAIDPWGRRGAYTLSFRVP
jgi:hypothetical protein